MPSFSWTKTLVFIGVALSHASLIGGLACLEGASPKPPENFILLELIPEPKPEAEPEPEPEIPSEAPAAETAGNEEPAETSLAAEAVAPEPPPAIPETLPEYQLEEVRDSASGNDGIVRGDTPDAGEKVEEVPEPNPPATTIPETADAAGTVLPEKESAAKQIGKQGDATATREGEFGSGGTGGESADATVRYRHRVAPKYPRADARAGRTGTVVLLLEIDENGELRNVHVKRSSGSRTLDAAAIRAARASKYFPAHNGERPVASRAEASYTFAR